MSPASHHNIGTHVSKWVDAFVQAAREGEVKQSFLLVDLPRVSELAADAKTVAALQARFRKVEQRVMVEGSVATVLQLTCQRCLQPVKIDVSDDFSVVIVPSESELESLSESQEAIVADPMRLDLAWLTEEQLLLAAPLVPVHELDQCGLAESPNLIMNQCPPSNEVIADAKLSSQRPFAALRDLMKKD
jgi:uncharacterized protein